MPRHLRTYLNEHGLVNKLKPPAEEAATVPTSVQAEVEDETRADNQAEDQHQAGRGMSFQRAQAMPGAGLSRRLLGLQRSIGNQAVRRVLAARQGLSKAAVQRNPAMGVIQRSAVTVEDYLSKMGSRTGNFSLGSCTRAEANKIATSWLGFKPTSKISVTEDGLRQYRKPSFKPSWGEWQANLEERDQPKGPWTTNAHITITDGDTN